LAPDIPVVLVEWCIAQLFLNALLAALVAVLPDQVRSGTAGSGLLAVCLPIASVSGTFVARLFTGNVDFVTDPLIHKSRRWFGCPGRA
jgi:hypothetical protein